MLSEGIATARGRSGAYLHHDAVNRRIRARRGARLTAITSGGAIPDTAQYLVVAEPEGTTVGTLDEDFAIESMAGDIFLLGTTSWRIRRVEAGRVRVEDAHGAAPTIPFWNGEAPGRTLELFAGRYERGLGLDVNQAMLAYAEGTIARARLSNAQVRHGDIYHLALPDACADAVVIHQVLHFLPEPGLAIREAARVTAPGGKLLIVDFAPHTHEFLREEHAHKRLGFTNPQIAQWLVDAGLKATKTTQLQPPAGDEPTLELCEGLLLVAPDGTPQAWSHTAGPVLAMLLSTVFENYRWSAEAAVGGALSLCGLFVALQARQAASPKR